MIVVGEIGPWAAGIGDAERMARCREMRALAMVYLGPTHPLTVMLGQSISKPDAATLETARFELGSIPALRRRRLIAAYMALLPDTRSDTRSASHTRPRARLGA